MFIHKLGNRVIDKKFINPSKEVFLKWKDEFIKEIEDTEYEIILLGNCAEIFYGNSKLKTFDVDIVFGSSNIDYKNIKKVFDLAINIGIKNRIFIDIKFINKKDILNHENKGTYYFIKPFTKIIGKGNKNIIRPDFYCEELPFDLWGKWAKLENLESIKKHRKRLNDGTYQGIKVDLKTMNIIKFNLTDKKVMI